MKPGSALFKTLALSSSLLLMGGYVRYRSGGSIPYIAPAKLEQPAPVLTPTQPSRDEIVVPQEILDQIKNDPTFLGGSKSDRVDFSPPSANGRKVPPGGSAQKPLPDILLDQNYEIIDLNKPDPGERTILYGSKSGAIDFRHPTDQGAAKKTPDTNNYETVIVPVETTVNGKSEPVYGLIQPEIPRVLLPGSKSAFPGIIRDKEKDESVQKAPNQKREEPKTQETTKQPEPPKKSEAQQQTPPERTEREFLPGSKSSPFRERDQR